MSWRPYAQEEALDLSTSAAAPMISPPITPGRHGWQLLQFYPDATPYVPYQPSYAFPPACSVPSISPISNRNWLPNSPPLLRSHGSSENEVDVDVVESGSLSGDAEYLAFERDALQAMAERNGGTLLGSNPSMRRAVQHNEGAEGNENYRKHRARNNVAAKQSRDRRKLREIRLSLKTTYLTRQVAQLKMELASRQCERCRRQR